MQKLLLFISLVCGAFAYIGSGIMSDCSFVATIENGKPHNISMLFFDASFNGSIKAIYDPSLEAYTYILASQPGNLCIYINGSAGSHCNDSVLYVADHSNNITVANVPIENSSKPQPISLNFCYENKQSSLFYVMVEVPGYCKVYGEDLSFYVEQV